MNEKHEPSTRSMSLFIVSFTLLSAGLSLDSFIDFERNHNIRKRILSIAQFIHLCD